MSVTISEETYGSVKKITFAWVADGAGAATGQTSNAFNGALERLVTVPGAGGLAPDPDYDITITDEDSTDTLMGAGADRHTANTEQVNASSLGVVANDKLTINVSAAGASNAGTAYLYIR